MGTRRLGAAQIITFVMGPQPLLHRPRIHLIALQASRIGRRAGQWKRSLGAAHTMAKDAVMVDANRLARLLHHLTARPDLPTGPTVGLSPKRPGVAPMLGSILKYVWTGGMTCTKSSACAPM